MKISHCVSALFLALLGWSSYLGAAEKEKVEEGRYALLKNGAIVQGSEHSWSLWRLPDGQFELEDHRQADTTSLKYLAVFVLALPSTPELQRSVQESIAPDDLSAIFDSGHQLRSLSVRGVNLNGDRGVGLKCRTSLDNVECTGTSSKARLRIHEPVRFFWWFDIPALLPSCPISAPGGESGNDRQKAVWLSFGNTIKDNDKMKIGVKAQPGAKISWGDAPELESADLIMSNLGLDTLVLGNTSFRVQKCKLEVRFEKGDPISLTTWTDANGVIVAVENAASPGYLFALAQYKRYSR